MAYHPGRKIQAREAYITGATLTLVAQQIGVAEATVRAWKKAATGTEDWDRLRAARNLASGGHEELVQKILGNFLELLDEVTRNVRDKPAEEQVQLMASLTDSLSKTMRGLSGAAPKLSRLGVAMEVLRLQGEFVRNHHPDLASAFMEMLEPFGNQLAREYG